MFTLYDLNMKKKEYPAGIKPLDIFISSISKRRNKQEIEGVSGSVDYGAVHDTRNIELKVLLKANDTQDYRLLRNVAYEFFGDDMYVVENYSPGKRLKISVDENFIPERFDNNQRFAEITLPGEVLGTPYFESIGTTQDIQQTENIGDSGIWGFGMGLIDDPDSRKYTHTGTSFRIYNAGNVPIHPFEQDLKITITNVQGSTSFLQLRNDTNGTTFRVNEALSSDKTIVINGAAVTINSLQEFRKTNRQYITLEPGWNQFSITGATNATVSFDTRFYYK